MMRTGLWIMVFLPMGLYRGAVWCGVKREEPQCKECLGLPGLQDILRFRACSNPELRSFWLLSSGIVANCFYLATILLKRSQNDPGLEIALVPTLQPAVYNSHDALLYYLCGGALGKSIRKKLSSWRLKEMHPILVLYFAFKEEGRAIEKRKKSYQW